MALGWLVARAVAPALGRRLAPGWLLACMGVGWMWDAIDWNGLITWATALSPLGSSLAGLGIAGGLPLASRSALRPVFHPQALGFLDRQPLAPMAWSRALLPWALLAAWPAGAIALLWAVPGRLAWALLWALVAGAVSVAAAAPGWRGLALGGGTALLGAGLIGVARVEGAPLGLVLALPGCLWGIGRLHRAGRHPAGPPGWRLPGRPRSALAALFREDLLGLLREDARALGGALAGSALIAGYFSFPATNGCCDAGELHTGAALALTLGGVGGAAVVAAVVARRGETLDPPGRTATALARAAALQGVALLGVGPLAAALAALVGGGVALGLHAWALAAGAVWVGTWRPWRPFNTGSYVAWSLLAGTAAVGGVALSAALGALATALAARRLDQLRRNPWARP